ncbi:MAG: HlyD family secretion protein, partial [Caldimicrobium sp.]
MKGIYKVIIFVVISSLLFFGCKNPKSPQEKEVLPKKEVKVGRGDIYLEVAATGAVKPQVGAQVKVGARISGRVERLFVKQGDYVKKGELIAVIEHEEIKRQVERYQSVYKDALAQLEKVKLTYPERIAAQKKTVQALQSELSQLEREAKRLEVLFKDGLISKTELERIERDREVKAYQLEAQYAQLKSLKLEYEKELERARAQVEIARKQLEEAKVREQYA